MLEEPDTTETFASSKPPSSTIVNKCPQKVQQTAKKPRKRKSMSQRWKEEREYLSKRISILNKTLEGLRRKRGVQEENSLWAAQAKDEEIKRKKAMELNSKLWHAVNEQLKFAKNLDEVYGLMKSVNVPEMAPRHPSTHEVHLGHTHEDRTKALHRIVDNYRANIEESIKNIKQSSPISGLSEGFTVSVTSSLDFDVVLDEVIALNYRKCSDIYFNSAYLKDLRIGDMYFKHLEQIDDSIVYLRKTIDGFLRYGGSCCSANIIRKRYLETNRDIIVWTHVFGDEKYPMDPAHRNYKEAGFMIFEAEEGTNTTKLTGKFLCTPLDYADAFYSPIPGVTTEAIFNGVKESLRALRQIRFAFETNAQASREEQIMASMDLVKISNPTTNC